MSYEPNTWSNGDTITAIKLNNMEAGVQDMNSDYTPTTWANGDTITAEKLNHIEQGIANGGGGGGGGGGGDLVNAVVIVTSDSTEPLALNGCITDASTVDQSLSGYIIAVEGNPIAPGSSVNVLVPNNGLNFPILNRTVEVTEGDATVTELNGEVGTYYALKISGDCSVKVTSQQ